MLLITQSLNLLAPPEIEIPPAGQGGGFFGETRRERNLANIDRYLADEFYKSRSRESLLVMFQLGEIDETEFLLFMQMVE